jgi:hypothetical protein
LHQRNLKDDKGKNPMKVGSLLGDKPRSSFFETLRYRVRIFPSGKVLLQSTQEEENVKAFSKAKRENTLEGIKPRRVTAAPLG